MNGFIIPLTHEEELIVRKRVSKRIAEHWKRSSEAFFRDTPGLDEKTGRERLAFYRSTKQQFWDNLAATRPDRAKLLGRDWMELRRRYSMPPPLERPIL